MIVSTIAAVFALVNTGIAQQEIVVIEQGSRYERAKKPVKLNNNISAIKFTPTQMVVGEINFSYERQISKNGSFEVSLGPTISNISLGDVQSHVFDPWGSYTYRTSRLGAFGELAYRYYPLDDFEALDRFYISPLMKVKVMNYGIADPSENLQETDGVDVRVNFAMNIGYQWWMSKTFCMDFYAGMGIGYQQIRTSYMQEQYIDPNWTYAWREEVATGARYVFNFGVKVGIGQQAK